MANSIVTPQAIAPLGNALAMPKPKTPKLIHINTTFHPGKITFTHKFGNGGSKEFNFHDPRTATEHIRRQIKSEWRHPEKNIGEEVNNDLDLS